MANTFVLIASSTVGSGGSSTFDFTNIPNTYTDLSINFSTRSNVGSGTYTAYNVSFNGGGDLTSRYHFGNGSVGSSGSEGSYITGWSPTNATTANVFGNSSLYVANYGWSANKTITIDGVIENISSSTILFRVAGMWSSSSAVNRITITDLSGSFMQYSTAYLYGIKNS